MALHLPGCKTETNGATLKLSISCLPNFLQVSQESQVLLRASQPPVSPLYTLQQISEFCWNFPIFFLICSFHKNHRFSLVLPYLPVYCFFTNAVNFQIFCNFSNCMQTWTYLFYCYCVSLFIGKAVSMESTWWNAPPIITTKCQACARESNRTLLFKGWIHNHYSPD